MLVEHTSFFFGPNRPMTISASLMKSDLLKRLNQ